SAWCTTLALQRAASPPEPVAAPANVLVLFVGIDVSIPVTLYFGETPVAAPMPGTATAAATTAASAPMTRNRRISPSFSSLSGRPNRTRSTARVHDRDRAGGGRLVRVEQRLACGRAHLRDVRQREVVRLAPPQDVVAVERHGHRRARIDGRREPDEARQAIERDVCAHVVLDGARERLEVPQHGERVELVRQRAEETALPRHPRVVVRVLARTHVRERPV